MTRTDPFAREAARAQAQNIAEAKAHELRNDIYNTMSEESGRRLMYRILETCGVYRTSFNTNALTMAFNEGQRNVGLLFQAQMISSCPEFFELMLKENQGERTQH